MVRDTRTASQRDRDRAGWQENVRAVASAVSAPNKPFFTQPDHMTGALQYAPSARNTQRRY